MNRSEQETVDSLVFLSEKKRNLYHKLERKVIEAAKRGLLNVIYNAEDRFLSQLCPDIEMNSLVVYEDDDTQKEEVITDQVFIEIEGSRSDNYNLFPQNYRRHIKFKDGSEKNEYLEEV